MKQYLDLCQRIIDKGIWVKNERTGVNCLTVINADFTYNVADNEFPLLTTRKSFYKSAIAELLGYLRGYNNAEDFRKVGCKTWDANANKNESWLNNPHRKGEDDMGRVYGVQGRQFKIAPTEEEFDLLSKYANKGDLESFNELQGKLKTKSLDQLTTIMDNLSKGDDHRGEILTFWNPGEFDQGCLRPCMYQHHFSVLGGRLYLNSYQRSCDVPLGLVFNQVQVFVLLKLFAQITGLECGEAHHKIVNSHIYEQQLDLMKNVQLKRKPFASPKLHINPKIKTLEDVLTWVTVDDFTVENYEHHDPIKYPFAV